MEGYWVSYMVLPPVAGALPSAGLDGAAAADVGATVLPPVAGALPSAGLDGAAAADVGATVLLTVAPAHPAAANSPHVPIASATRRLVVFMFPLRHATPCFLVGSPVPNGGTASARAIPKTRAPAVRSSHGSGNGLATRGLAPCHRRLVRGRPGAGGSFCGARAVAIGAQWTDEFSSAERAARRRPAAGYWRALLALRSGTTFRCAPRVGGA